MAHFNVHCKDCMDELGDSFKAVHEWLDELFSIFGPRHRCVRHNAKGISYIKEQWGDKAERAAQIHIIRDCGETPIKGEFEKDDQWKRISEGLDAFNEEINNVYK